MANYFVDREVEHPGRVNIEAVDTNLMTASIDEYGVVSFSNSEDGFVADLTRAEGTVTEEGTPLNAYNLNKGVASLVSDAIFGYTIEPTFVALIDAVAGAEYVVIWRAHGTSGSGGMDYIWLDENSTPIVRNVYLSGTQLPVYNSTTGGEAWGILNSASSSMIHVTVIRQKPTVVQSTAV